eukprot:CAMPEP_0176369598 /NCGR_PEP_ID=MMETSP0126-20121128/23402_1 /TAXON_ID=141414 ORGANISM="Strombidinopsis acuminatum, Strain SPMC142" /NCGR_SAMPLE_ID=MMETSP0126 /ASSEMBLY_ACC=CAM_ASM_000229 /LENGTH=67 /DNA_ID=CAMNT_0017728303 /DNA_START=996 /DNA_END=1199 /DNA_ORIENTATION=+
MSSEFETALKEEIKKLGPVKKTQLNLIEWQYFLDAKDVITKFGFKAIEAKSGEFTTKRRSLLREKKM